MDLVADAVITRIVGRQCFLPPPSVDSAVVRIDLKDKGFSAEEIKEARRIIRAAFNMRRKTLSNALAGALGGKESAAELCRAFGKAMEQNPGWRVYIISSLEQFENAYGKRAQKRRKFYNGMIPCQLYMYF